MKKQKEYLNNKKNVGGGVLDNPLLYRNTQKGITLIALIITIIVLLILAMVSIKLVWDRGIIEHANNAVNKYNEAQENEMDQLNKAEEMMNQYAGTTDNKWWELTKEEYDAIANSDFGEVIAWNGSDPSGNEVTMIQVLAYDEKNYGFFIINRQEGIWLDFLTDSAYEEDAGNVEDIKETYQWYNHGSSMFGQIDRYEGPCPVQLSDFTYITEGCEGLLQRIIDSFNM